MEYFGLILEIIFLALGIYIYLFSRGVIKSKTPEAEKKAAIFRDKNGRWLRIVAIMLIAVMSIEIILHIRDLMN